MRALPGKRLQRRRGNIVRAAITGVFVFGFGRLGFFPPEHGVHPFGSEALCLTLLPSGFPFPAILEQMDHGGGSDDRGQKIDPRHGQQQRDDHSGNEQPPTVGLP